VLPSENRLRRRQDFAIAVRRGRRAGRQLLVVHFVRGGTAEQGGAGAGGPVADAAAEQAGNPHGAEGSPSPARAGFVVSKAVGSAVVRNRVKRRLRHLVRERLALLPPGSLVVVRALPPAAAAEYAELARDLDGALRRVLDSVTGAGR
jgi:ribonuclease P protein component